MRHSESPGILVFVMPFAAPAAVRHAEKLIDCLTPAAGAVLVVGDARINMSGRPPRVQQVATVPTLHYLREKQPPPLSVLIWLLKLFWILLTTCKSIFASRTRTDIVVCFLGMYYAPILLFARLLGKKTISFEPGTDLLIARKVYGEGPKGKALMSIVRLARGLNRLVAHRLVVESVLLVDMAGMRRFYRKVRVGNLYVDTDAFAPTTLIESRPRAVGYIGRLSPAKGIIELVRGAGMLRDEGVSLTIVGDGPLRGAVELMLRRPEYSNSKLAGWVDPSQIGEMLNEFRLLVLPSEAEGMPNVVLEAMACGTPVLATPVGAIPDLVRDGETGCLLSDTCPGTIAEGIRMMLMDSDLTRISASARSFVTSSFSLQSSVDTWKEIVDELNMGETTSRG